ncbi:XdhC family protein [Sphingobium sp.]|uniref:XdhC family protein n=1 Tax=Sphingobium sp. TaxID=1912891 RepID=UPI0028BF3C9A|nr:XdhC family protein [Sphingobium sp.]
MNQDGIEIAAAADLDQAALRFAAERDATLCTIVGIEGSFSRRLGAQLAVSADGRTVIGCIADGCLEKELAAQAAHARAMGAPRLLRYGKGSSIVDFRLPCGSGLDILVDPFPDRAALAGAVRALDRRQAVTLPLAPAGAALLPGRRFIPSLRLMILGAGSEAYELARVAKAYGTDVELVGPGDGLALGRRPEGLSVDPWTAIAILFHDHEWEAALLEWALDTPAFYIGAQGGQSTRERRRASLEASGHGEEAVARVRSPIGLVPHARDARTLALSVLAEVVAFHEEGRDRAGIG